MYVCLCVYIYIYTHLKCMCILYIHIYMCMCCVYICICAYMYVCAYVYAICIHMYIILFSLFNECICYQFGINKCFEFWFLYGAFESLWVPIHAVPIQDKPRVVMENSMNGNEVVECSF